MKVVSILLSEMAEIINSPCVYFLFNESVIVYIGSTNRSVYQRIESHLKEGKTFDRAEVHIMKSHKWAIIFENVYISHFAPLYNKSVIEHRFTTDFGNEVINKYKKTKGIRYKFYPGSWFWYRNNNRLTEWEEANRGYFIWSQGIETNLL